MNEQTINSVAEFVSLATKLKSLWLPEQPNWCPWFRGHASSSWKLIPKIYRRLPTHHSIRIVEDELRQEFVIRAPGLTGLSENPPQNSWDWYFTMQHCGSPTRLLDWTEGALLALYFAVRDNKSSNAVVWALNPWWLNTKIVGEREVVAPGATAGMLTADGKRYEPWLQDRYSSENLPQMPVAVYPTHSARRISTQRSCFTIHGSDVDGLEKLSEVNESHLVKILVPDSAVRVIKEQLMVCGVDEITIFPDVDGLGRLLSTMLDIESGI